MSFCLHLAASTLQPSKTAFRFLNCTPGWDVATAGNPNQSSHYNHLICVQELNPVSAEKAQQV